MADLEGPVKATPEEIENWKKQYKDIFEVDIGEFTFFVRKPTRQEFTRYFDTSLRSPFSATLTLVTSCLLKPAGADYIAILEEKPGLHVALTNELQDKIGLNLTASSKKL
jgi:alpha-amylase/alpha-mannosidase (GH57 family)